MNTYDELCRQKYTHDIDLASAYVDARMKRLIARFVIDGGYSLRFYTVDGDKWTEHSGLAAACRAYDAEVR